MVVGPLNTKLIRDLLHLKAQVASIVAVVGIGVAVFFGFTSTHQSLKKSRDDFYQSSNFGNVFAFVKKAPSYAAKKLAQIEGIQEVETRLEYDALLSIPKMEEPAVGHFIGIPDGRQPITNQLFIKRGRLPSAVSSDEVVVSEGFFKAHDFQLGDGFTGTLNGRKKFFRIVGVGVTAEYVIALQAGSPFPDDRHFTVIWLNNSVLAGSYDMHASFNSLVMKTSAGVDEKKMIQIIDNQLSKYGGVGAFGRDRQVSNVFVREELKQLQVQSTSIPIIFFLVAAFILNIVISRLVRAQRSEIATLKAVGYFDRDVSSYYFKVAGLVVLMGSLLGVLLGLWIGDSMIRLYGSFYRFPTLSYDFTFSQVAMAMAIALFTAFGGTFSALRKIFRLRPAEAMRPPAPRRFHQSFVEKRPWFRAMRTRGRMTVRGVVSYPVRSVMTGIGLSFSIVLLIIGLFWNDTTDHLILAQYSFVQKETGKIQLVQSVAPGGVYEVQRLQGVLEAEGYRNVPVKVRFQNREQSTSIKGYPSQARLQGVINEDLQELSLPEGGIYMSQILADQLKVIEGDWVDVEVLEGRKFSFPLKVEKVLETFMNSELLTSRKVLSRIMKTGDQVNEILFRSFTNSTSLYAKLKEMPNVLAVSYRDSALQVFNDTSAKFLLVFALILTLFAGAIGFGISYNNMRVTLAERDWELATLRILGFRIREVFSILISEVVFLASVFIPVGWILGYFMAQWLLDKMSMEAFRLPFVVDSMTFFLATMTMVISTLLSAYFIYRRVSQLDMVATLKSRG